MRTMAEYQVAIHSKIFINNQSMNSKTLNFSESYASPMLEVIELNCEGALCDISSSEDYGGVSDDELPIF